MSPLRRSWIGEPRRDGNDRNLPVRQTILRRRHHAAEDSETAPFELADAAKNIIVEIATATLARRASVGDIRQDERREIEPFLKRLDVAVKSIRHSRTMNEEGVTPRSLSNSPMRLHWYNGDRFEIR